MEVIFIVTESFFLENGFMAIRMCKDISDREGSISGVAVWSLEAHSSPPQKPRAPFPSKGSSHCPLPRELTSWSLLQSLIANHLAAPQPINYCPTNLQGACHRSPCSPRHTVPSNDSLWPPSPTRQEQAQSQVGLSCHPIRHVASVSLI